PDLRVDETTKELRFTLRVLVERRPPEDYVTKLVPPPPPKATPGERGKGRGKGKGRGRRGGGEEDGVAKPPTGDGGVERTEGELERTESDRGMTEREKELATLLLGVVALVGSGAAFHALALRPYFDAADKLDKAEGELNDKELDLLAERKQRQKIVEKSPRLE